MTRISPLTLDYAAPSSTEAGDHRIVHGWFVFLCIALAGYAINGKSFAYLGYPPLFIGELLFASGLIVLLCYGHLRELFDTPLTWLLLAFCGWGLYRTVPYIGEYRIDAIRDAVIWGYIGFAFIVAGLLIAKPQTLPWLLERYSSAVAWILGLLLVVNFMHRVVAPKFLLILPWVNVSMFHQKEGDVLVHLSGILLFWATTFSRRPSWWLIVLWAVQAAINCLLDRAGALSIVMAMGVCLLVRSASTIPWRIAFVGVVGVLFLWVTALSIELPLNKGRAISFDQILANAQSVIGDSGHDSLDGTREWRLLWWRDIMDYTVRGPYFWTGKGFGINLANDDGYQVGPEESLRSPHNIHMTVLARMGVPGLVLWALILVGWAVAIAWHYVLAELRGRRRWADLFLWIGGFWMALLINAAFDVALEGPMGAIWFWSLHGTGMAAMWLYRRRPDLMDPPCDDVSPVTVPADAA